ncbi:MAG: hypothetical protein AAB658_11860, partial [Chloroflexota bacterium]
MNASKRSPLVTLAALAVYFFLYSPIVVLMVFALNASKTNVIFEGIVTQFGPVRLEDNIVVQSPCGPFHWFCVLAQNDEVLDAARNTLTIAFTSTLIATAIGTMAALALQRYSFPVKNFSEAALYIPIVIPEIVMGIGILVLFSALFTWINATFGLVNVGNLFRVGFQALIPVLGLFSYAMMGISGWLEVAALIVFFLLLTLRRHRK